MSWGAGARPRHPRPRALLEHGPPTRRSKARACTATAALPGPPRHTGHRGSEGPRRLPEVTQLAVVRLHAEAAGAPRPHAHRGARQPETHHAAPLQPHLCPEHSLGACSTRGPLRATRASSGARGQQRDPCGSEAGGAPQHGPHSGCSADSGSHRTRGWEEHAGGGVGGWRHQQAPKVWELGPQGRALCMSGADPRRGYPPGGEHRGNPPAPAGWAPWGVSSTWAARVQSHPETSSGFPSLPAVRQAGQPPGARSTRPMASPGSTACTPPRPATKGATPAKPLPPGRQARASHPHTHTHTHHSAEGRPSTHRGAPGLTGPRQTGHAPRQQGAGQDGLPAPPKGRQWRLRGRASGVLPWGSHLTPLSARLLI